LQASSINYSFRVNQFLVPVITRIYKEFVQADGSVSACLAIQERVPLLPPDLKPVAGFDLGHRGSAGSDSPNDSIICGDPLEDPTGNEEGKSCDAGSYPDDVVGSRTIP
jgi:hypothetical protein